MNNEKNTSHPKVNISDMPLKELIDYMNACVMLYEHYDNMANANRPYAQDDRDGGLGIAYKENVEERNRYLRLKDKIFSEVKYRVDCLL